MNYKLNPSKKKSIENNDSLLLPEHSWFLVINESCFNCDSLNQSCFIKGKKPGLKVEGDYGV